MPRGGTYVVIGHAAAPPRRTRVASFPVGRGQQSTTSLMERGGLAQDSKINSPMSALGWRVQPIDATPSNLTREGGVRWRGLHGYGSRRSRGLSFGSAGRTVNVWRISLGRLRGGTRAVSIVSWLSMVALLRSRAGELRER